ncbi:MAG TPA: 3-dehydroquinate synthase [Candidatus Baltobacteraceae bacterium]|nr:3-dehydroquinate synthase [Candidatus Baltobacteraceae bacterium]
MPANVYLCGPPGAGKSTLAPLLASLRGHSSVDLDAFVETEAGASIVTLFEREGEPAFRARERRAIAELTKRDGIVVALGGGTLEDAANRRALAGTGTLVFLDASLETCAERSARDGSTRPLLKRRGALEGLYAARRPGYLSAAVRVCVDGRTPAEIAGAVEAAMRQERVVRVATARPYDVVIGPSAVAEMPERAAPRAGGRVLVVSDARVDVLGERVARIYEAAGFRATVLRLQADEALKSLEALGTLYARFAEAEIDRRSLVVGVGGGTIGDAVGFAAATFARGIPYAAVPTTLLAAVDAAIGGKTALNLPAGKNLVGTVTQPVTVAVEPHAFRTLDSREVVSGYGEMLKYGLALDAPLYASLRANETALLDDPAAGHEAIARCVELKARIVERDEYDRSGLRAVLNFGHTVGHAIEKVAGYGRLRHGEAVILGMRAAIALSSARGLLAEAAWRRIDEHLAGLPLPALWRELDGDAVAAATQHDKKRHARGTRYVLLEDIGSARLDDGVELPAVRRALEGIGMR